MRPKDKKLEMFKDLITRSLDDLIKNLLDYPGVHDEIQRQEQNNLADSYHNRLPDVPQDVLRIIVKDAFELGWRSALLAAKVSTDDIHRKYNEQ